MSKRKKPLETSNEVLKNGPINVLEYFENDDKNIVFTGNYNPFSIDLNKINFIDFNEDEIKKIIKITPKPLHYLYYNLPFLLPDFPSKFVFKNDYYIDSKRQRILKTNNLKNYPNYTIEYIINEKFINMAKSIDCFELYKKEYFEHLKIVFGNIINENEFAEKVKNNYIEILEYITKTNGPLNDFNNENILIEYEKHFNPLGIERNEYLQELYKIRFSLLNYEKGYKPQSNDIRLEKELIKGLAYIDFLNWLKKLPNQSNQSNQKSEISTTDKILRELDIIYYIFKSQFQKNNNDLNQYPLILSSNGKTRIDGDYMNNYQLYSNTELFNLQSFKKEITQRLENCNNTTLLKNYLIEIHNLANKILDFYNNNLIDNCEIVENFKAKYSLPIEKKFNEIGYHNTNITIRDYYIELILFNHEESKIKYFEFNYISSNYDLCNIAFELIKFIDKCEVIEKLQPGSAENESINPINKAETGRLIYILVNECNFKNYNDNIINCKNHCKTLNLKYTDYVRQNYNKVEENQLKILQDKVNKLKILDVNLLKKFNDYANNITKAYY